MLNSIKRPAFALFVAALILSCNEDEVKPDLRADFDYTTLKNDVAYSDQFMDATGVTTVDLTDGNNRHRMFQALNYNMTSNISANTTIDAAQLKKLFSNTGNPFIDISTSSINVTGAELNTSDVQLRNVTASSKSNEDAEVVRLKLEADFDALETASLSITEVAENGQAGKLGSRLVDAKGIEIAQIIQKSLIGALELDYIGNVLLNSGLDADNHSLVSGKVYTQLEHNWDEAYGLLTLNPVYLYNTSTSTASRLRGQLP
jgi:hypothetical protein